MKPCKSADSDFVKVNFRVEMRMGARRVQISTWKVFFIIKNIFIMKNQTDFRKTVETGVDSRLSLLKPSITLGLNFIMISFFAIEINIT